MADVSVQQWQAGCSLLVEACELSGVVAALLLLEHQLQAGDGPVELPVKMIESDFLVSVLAGADFWACRKVA
jgi:hypothetical protein